uniref:Malate dehydrogenase 1B, NAD (soluble) n=1 Tax=Sphaeramia orbicularis TaxID=375764 RepID=A0A672YV85_9TELE
ELKFLVSGKTDCPYYAKAELLADTLQRCLPDFRTHKIAILPDEWKEWLESTCQKNGWKHVQSPLIWRELVDQGGKGMFLGGFSDFLEHCQDYYNITSDMSTEMMLKVAEENLSAKMSLIVDEQQRLILPHLSSALSPTCLFLIPNLLSAEVFPNVSMISIHLLDLEGTKEDLQGLKMETEDLAAPLLYQARDGENEEEKKNMIKSITECYKEYGRLINERAKKVVKVMVSGDSFVNLKCSLLLENASSINCCCFVAAATQLENEARVVIAKKLNVTTSDVTDVIVWGNISGSFFIDLQRAKVYNYDGAIKGPAFFSQPVQQIIYDRKWLETEFQDLVRYQRAAVTSKTCRTAAMSAANGILTVLKAWSGTGRTDQVLSVGVYATFVGKYDLPEDVILSVPVTFTAGKWSVVPEVNIEDKLRDKLRLSATELRQVCQVTKK